MKLMIFPMNRELAVMVRGCRQLCDYDEILPVAPKGFGYDGDDIAAFDGGPETGILVQSDHKKMLPNADAVFVDYCDSVLRPQDYSDVIESALAAEKKVFATRFLYDYLKDAGYEIHIPETHILHFSPNSAQSIREKKLLEIPVPCVLVFGAGESTNKFDIQLALRKEFQAAGYQVTQLGSKPYSALFGIEPLPGFLFEKEYLHQKILALNHYVYEKAMAEESDAVIIGVPGGILPINPYEYKECGELAFIIAAATRPDEAILSLYTGEYTSDMLQNLINVCKYRFNTAASHICISNFAASISQESIQTEYTSVTTEWINREIIAKEKQFDLFSALDESEMQRVAREIITKLESAV